MLSDLANHPNRGIIPRALAEIFENLPPNSTVVCSFIQVYNEKIYDMLADTDIGQQLNIREDKALGLHVEQLREFLVLNVWDALNLMIMGERNRITRATLLN